MMKLPNDPDQFKHFRGDPPEVKLKAWKQMQERLAIRDRTFAIALVVGIVVAAIGRW